MKSKCRYWLLGVAGCLVMAILTSTVAVPRSALAKKPDGNNGGGGNGQFNTQGYWMWFSADPLGAFAPDGPDPSGIYPDDVGSLTVAGGSISQPDDPEMIININQTCLETGMPLTDPLALKGDDQFWTDSPDDFDACFPTDSFGTAIISADGATVQVHVQGLTKAGRDLGYWLTIDVNKIEIDGDVGLPADMWKPVGDESVVLQPGQTATLYLGTWELAPSNPKHRSRGCVATGDFSDDVDPDTGTIGTDIKVRRWTLAEQAAHDACE